MADYYPLLSRALEALPDRSPALRKAVYDRARGALIGQLRSLEPPIPEADIDLERQALDAAIERLEADYGAPPMPKPGKAEAPPPAVPAAPAPPPPPIAAPPTLPEPEPPQRTAGIERQKPPVTTAAAVSPEPPPVAARSEPAAPESPAVPFVPPVRKPKAAEPEADPPPAEPEPIPAPAPDVEAASLADALAAELGNGRQRPKIEVVAPRAGRSRLVRNGVVGALLLLVIGAIAVAAFMLRDQPAELPDTAENGVEAPAEAPDSKFADRVGGGDAAAVEPAEPAAASPTQDGAPAPAAQQEVMVAQRAILYEENAADPKAQPTSSTGRVTWRLEPVNGEQGEPLQNAVRANVEFPDAGLTLAMTIKKNLDSTLPASHTVELAFTNSGKGEARGVQDIGLLQLKDDANTRGSPVSGLPVRVRDNLFLIGLSNLPSDIERNSDMLLRKNWLDLALKYRSGQRAVLAFDKGNAGTQVMQSAFDQWRTQ